MKSLWNTSPLAMVVESIDAFVAVTAMSTPLVHVQLAQKTECFVLRRPRHSIALKRPRQQVVGSATKSRKASKGTTHYSQPSIANRKRRDDELISNMTNQRVREQATLQGVNFGGAECKRTS